MRFFAAQFPLRNAIFTVASIGCIAATLCTAWSQTPLPAAPATQPTLALPTAKPSSNEPAPNAPMRRWFDRLADADPKVRDQARVDLMGLAAVDLPKLRQLVIDHEPLRPAQASVLHDIVIHCVLADDGYKVAGDVDTTAKGTEPPYFMGILWSNQLDIDARLGVTVDERLPGFPSFRYLRTGDMILGIYMDPALSLLQYPNTETHTRDQLINAIGSRPETQDVVLQVLRDGEQIRIALKMAPRPIKADHLNREGLKVFTNDRADRADAYWQEQFVPLLESTSTAVAAD